jgi:NADP-reducing hydrogenase subunit HndB
MDPIKKVNSREELKALREKYRDNVIMRLVSDDQKTRTEIYVAVGNCGIEAGARDTLKAIFDEVNAARLEKVSVIVSDCSKGCDDSDAPKIDGLFLCGHDRMVDVVYPGEEPVRYKDVDAAKAKEIVGTIAKRLEGQHA